MRIQPLSNPRHPGSPRLGGSPLLRPFRRNLLEVTLRRLVENLWEPMFRPDVSDRKTMLSYRSLRTIAPVSHAARDRQRERKASRNRGSGERAFRSLPDRDLSSRRRRLKHNCRGLAQMEGLLS